MILSQHLAMAASKNASSPVLFYLGKPIAYSDFKVRVAKLSYLLQREIGHQHRVAFYARNSPAVAAAFYALTNTRNLSIFLDPDRPPDEIIESLKDSRATHLFVTNDLVGRGREILQAAHLNLP